MCDLIAVVKSDSENLWNSITILKKALQNQNARSVIANYLNCVQVVTNLYPNVNSLERKVSLLYLLREMTFGIDLRWPHTYLDDLLVILYGNIFSGGANENVVILSLSIMNNLCYKNPTVTQHVIYHMPCKISEFYNRVSKNQKYLTRKLMFSFREQERSITLEDYNYFIMKSFLDVEKAIM